MPQVYWSTLATFAPLHGAAVDDLWFVAAEVIRDCTYIRIVAEGEWNTPWTAAAGTCGPNGQVGAEVPANQLLTADCLVGAIVGRLGGSSAGYAAGATDIEKGKPFPIGAYCVMPVSKGIWPLFVGFNTVKRPIQVTRLTLTIEGATPTL